jgi:hypothetical protein
MAGAGQHAALRWSQRLKSVFGIDICGLIS